MSTKEKIRLLYVDDENINLLAFRANFRRDYEVFTAISGKEGKELIEKHDIKIIVADQRMPSMSGVEFFEWIRIDHPDTIRILLTGFSDIESVIDAINKGKVYSYVTKPWNEHELQQTFESAYKENQQNEYYRSLEERYDHLFKDTSDAILTLNIEGSIINANRAALKLFNYSVEEIVTIDLDALFQEGHTVTGLLKLPSLNKQVVIDKFQNPSDIEVSATWIGSRKAAGASIQVILKNA